MDYQQIFKLFEVNKNVEYAKSMSAYMRDQFPHLGISAPKRKELSKDFLNRAKKEKSVNWTFVEECWNKDEREFQYLAIDYLNTVKNLLTPDDIEPIGKIATVKSWWDSIDGLDTIVGHIALNYPAINEVLLEWSLDDNIWLRRIAIDHQLLRKEKTDTALLEKIIVNNFGQKEFFINKAIGWSLRQYSKTNPEWVRSFITRHKDKLAQLSIREAGKYI